MFLVKKRNFLTLFISIILVISLLIGCSQDVQLENQPITTEEEQSGLFVNLAEDSVDEENIYSIIEELSTSKYQGRLTGSEGNKLAAEYISAYFKEIGLENPKGLENYMQYYTQKTIDFNITPTLEIVDKEGNTIKEYEYLENFTTFIYPYSKYQGDTIGEPLIVENAELLQNIELIKGKILIIPQDVYKEVGSREIITTSIQVGVKGLIIEQTTDSKERYGHLISYVHLGQHSGPSNDEGYMYRLVDSDTLMEIIELSKDNMIKMSMDCPVEYKEVANVIGLLPGTDEELKNQFILITAHMDHNGSFGEGKYLPGAFDNASGTAVMMELARVLKENEIQPKKSILFIAFNGEEEGLIGSQWYANNPIYPLDNSILINMDMVGSKKEVPLDLTTADKDSVTLARELADYASNLNIKYQYVTASNSDHASFNGKPVKAVTLLNPDWETIHRPEDTIDKVDKKRLGEVAKLVLYYLDKNAY